MLKIAVSKLISRLSFFDLALLTQIFEIFMQKPLYSSPTSFLHFEHTIDKFGNGQQPNQNCGSKTQLPINCVQIGQCGCTNTLGNNGMLLEQRQEQRTKVRICFHVSRQQEPILETQRYIQYMVCGRPDIVF